MGVVLARDWDPIGMGEDRGRLMSITATYAALTTSPLRHVHQTQSPGIFLRWSRT